MSPPTSHLFEIQDIPNAGRGVIASQSLPHGTEALQSGPPIAHVIFRQYRKEVCARCFFYDLGRTLPVRHASTGKVFCSIECRDGWLEEEGELGVKAWENLHKFVLARSKGGRDSDESMPDRGTKPRKGEIEDAWRRIDESLDMRIANGKKRPSSGSGKTPDADILSYLLCSIIFAYREPEAWKAQVAALALDETPYSSTADLAVHTSSYQDLCSLLPAALMPSCTTSLCHQAVSAASHNSFGIRSADGEEYMGYALHPSASYFNHSCAPNIAKARTGGQWIFSAGRDIEAGEECCITYLGGDEKDLQVHERRARLQEHWGFACACLRCREESKALKAHD